MQTIPIPDLPWEEQYSPARKFHSFCRNVSLAPGGLRNTGAWGGGHPFDLQIRRIPPGAAVCPFHSHFAQWELFVVQAGNGTVRAGDGFSALPASIIGMVRNRGDLGFRNFPCSPLREQRDNRLPFSHSVPALTRRATKPPG